MAQLDAHLQVLLWLPLQVLPAERQKACRNLVKEYFNSLTKHLVMQHKDLRTMEKQNWKILQVGLHLDQSDTHGFLCL